MCVKLLLPLHLGLKHLLLALAHMNCHDGLKSPSAQIILFAFHCLHQMYGYSNAKITKVAHKHKAIPQCGFEVISF